MNTAQRKFLALKSELVGLVEKVDSALEEIESEKKDIPLSKRQVAELMEYTGDYIYKLNIPFGAGGTISYGDLEEWVSRNRPARLGRLRTNVKELVN